MLGSTWPSGLGWAGPKEISQRYWEESYSRVIYFLQFSVISDSTSPEQSQGQVTSALPHIYHLTAQSGTSLRVRSTSVQFSKLIICLLLHLKIMVNKNIIMHKSERIPGVESILRRFTGPQQEHLQKWRPEQMETEESCPALQLALRFFPLWLLETKDHWDTQCF